MKTTRTVRTLKRAGVSAPVGFTGVTPPSGKYIRRLAKRLRAEARLLEKVGGRAFNALHEKMGAARHRAVMAAVALR